MNVRFGWLHRWWAWFWVRRIRVDYVGGSEVLPPPLTPEEEARNVALFLGGDGKAKDVLIAHNLRLVVYIARKFDNTGFPLEDLISAGAIGLIKAVGTFDPEKKIKLATYASRCIENEILMFLRRNGKTRHEISFDEPLSVDWDGNELLMRDIMGTAPDIVSRGLDDAVDRKTINQAVDQLPAREKLIIRMRFGMDGKGERTQKEVADLLGISQSYISRLEKRILKRLHKEIQSKI